MSQSLLSSLMRKREEDYEKIYDRWEKMVAYQRKIHPFTPTFVELMNVFGLKSKSAVFYVLKGMEKRGLVISRRSGDKKHQYFAID